jgi:Thioredoxin
MDRVFIALVLLAFIATISLAVRRREAPGAPSKVDLGDLGLAHSTGVGVVGFSTPYCLPCRHWEQALGRTRVPFMKIDLSERPELASRYEVTSTPLILAVSLADGTVVDAFHGDPQPSQLERLEQLTAA